MTLVDFDTEVRVAKYGQLDFPRLVERIRARKPSGFTAMYDALGVYLDSAAEAQGRKILVLFTDGGDTRSTIRFGDVLTLVRASDVTVYSVGFLENQPSSVRARAAAPPDAARRRERRRGLLPVPDEADRGGLRQDPDADSRAVQPRLHLDEHRDRRQLAQSRDQGRVVRTPRICASSRARATSRPTASRSLVWSGPSPDARIKPDQGQHKRPRTVQSSSAMPSVYDQFKLVSDFEIRGDQVRAVPELVEGLNRGDGHSGAARRHRIRQDLHDGAGAGAGEPADAGHGAQQDAGRAALSGVQALLPRERRRVLRQLLRLLPARGLRPGHRLLHREGSDDQRRDRSHAAVGHALALRAARRHHRRQRLVHLRPGIAGGVLRAAAGARSRASGSIAIRSCASWSKSSTSATTRSSAAAPSASAATSSKWCRRTKSTRCASACSATRWTSWPGSTR